MGRLLIIGGCTGLTGAVTLAARAALRSGVGLVTCAVPESLNSIFEVKLTEAMTVTLPDKGEGRLTPDSLTPLFLEHLERVQALVVGPGLGRHSSTGEFLEQLWEKISSSFVLDADALWHLAEQQEVLRAGDPLRVLTPHAGEMQTLEMALSHAPGSRQEIARRFARKIPGVLVLKGPGSLIAERDQLFVNPSGNPGLASGGTGDVLAGIIGAFLARGEIPRAAAQRGVWLHGRAADIAAYGTGSGDDGVGEESLLASDVIAALPRAIRELQERPCSGA